MDRVAQWEAIAAQQYREDGVVDGWDSGPDEEETAEQKYIKVPSQAHAFHPCHQQYWVPFAGVRMVKTCAPCGYAAGLPSAC